MAALLLAGCAAPRAPAPPKTWTFEPTGVPGAFGAALAALRSGQPDQALASCTGTMHDIRERVGLRLAAVDQRADADTAGALRAELGELMATTPAVLVLRGDRFAFGKETLRMCARAAFEASRPDHAYLWLHDLVDNDQHTAEDALQLAVAASCLGRLDEARTLLGRDDVSRLGQTREAREWLRAVEANGAMLKTEPRCGNTGSHSGQPGGA